MKHQITRRSFVRAIGAATILVPTLGAGRCNPPEVLRWAGRLLSTIRSAIPIVRSFAPQIAGKLDAILPVIEKLKTAIEVNDATSAVAWLRQILPVFVDVIDHDIPSLPEALQQKVLIALAVADIALNFIASFYDQNAPAGMKAQGGVDVISAFSRRPVWGHKYAH